MAALTGISIKEMQQELDSQVFQNPQDEWETGDEYLSGNVRDKLKTAEAAAALANRRISGSGKRRMMMPQGEKKARFGHNLESTG